MRAHSHAWLLTLFLATNAMAGNGVSGVTVTKERQLVSVAIKAVVQGDDDSSAVIRIFQRWQDAGDWATARPAAVYDSGMVMVRRPHGSGGSAAASGEIFGGRILNMQPGKVCEYYLEVSDNGGGSGIYSIDTTSCTVIRQIVATGPVFYVQQGVPAGGNGSQARPYNTINLAVTALGASTNSGGNGGIFVGPGEYHERIDLNSTNFATDGLFRFIEGYPGQKDSTIMCGANENVEAGNSSSGVAMVWTKALLGAPTASLTYAVTSNDSIYKTYFPSGVAGPADSTGLIVIGWGEQLHHKTSLLAMQVDSTKVTGVAASTNSGEASGWYWQNDTLYIKRRSGKSILAGEVVHAGYRNNLIEVRRRNWRIANMTFRFSGGVTTNLAGGALAEASTGPDGHGIRAGLGATDASGLVVDSCSFYGNNARSVYLALGSGPRRADSSVVANCSFDGLTVGGMTYGAGKSRTEEIDSQLQIDCRACVAYNNTITGTFNGIGCSGVVTDSVSGSNCGIINNTITNVTDDAIELDGAHQINSLVYGNVTRNTGRALSIAPCFTGPIFVLYNYFTRFQTVGLKGGGSGGAALVRCQQNTFSSPVAGSVAVNMNNGAACEGMLFENNIFDGNGAAGTGIAVTGPPSGGLTNSFNWNVITGNGGSSVAADWFAGTTRTLATLRSALTYEKNGMQTSALCFTDSSAFDYTPGRLSSAKGNGRRITGVNTGLYGPRYNVQSGPDQGAAVRPFGIQ